MNTVQSAKAGLITLRNCGRAVCLAICLLVTTGCGSDEPATQDDAEHFLSDQQEALERSKETAAAVEEAAAARARQTESAREN